MKQSILILLATMSLLGVTQNAMAIMPNRFFYLGVDVGAANLMNKESHSVSPESHQLGDVDAIGGGFIGYDICLTGSNRLAIEAFVDAMGSQTSITHSPNTYKMNQRYNLGIRLLPAYLFTPTTLGHLIFGYTRGHFRINDNGVYGLINANYTRSGFQAGFGLATVLRHNLFVRLDVLHTGYSSHSDQGIGLPGNPPFQFYTNGFSQLAGELGLYYTFC